MDLNHNYTVEEVLEIALTLKPEDRKKVQEEIQKSLLNEKEILDKISPFHQKYEATYKTLA
ncbi:MAG: hypothetical protein V5804_02090 [Mucilaginibacter sp.]|uniref:hypothetical protein n=1 Tax=Mucilaginibacter sp. TaxID=1882438 RepID=UPI0034E3C6FE